MKSQEWKAIQTAYEEGYADFISDIEKQIDDIRADTIDDVSLDEDPQVTQNRTIEARAKIKVLTQILENVSGEETSVTKKDKSVVGL